MIEPLNITNADPLGPLNMIQEKINELIAAHNELFTGFLDHYHESLDTHYNTTSPKFPVIESNG